MERETGFQGLRRNSGAVPRETGTQPGCAQTQPALMRPRDHTARYRQLETLQPIILPSDVS
jgi:hypothetical protein